MSTNRSEFLNIANHLKYADNLFNKYKTFYNEQQNIGKENYLLFMQKCVGGHIYVFRYVNIGVGPDHMFWKYK